MQCVIWSMVLASACVLYARAEPPPPPPAAAVKLFEAPPAIPPPAGSCPVAIAEPRPVLSWLAHPCHGRIAHRAGCATQRAVGLVRFIAGHRCRCR